MYTFTREELKTKRASDFKEGDIISVGIYFIFIHYESFNGNGRYKTPSLASYHERHDFKKTGCTPGVNRPYFINDFLGR